MGFFKNFISIKLLGGPFDGQSAVVKKSQDTVVFKHKAISVGTDNRVILDTIRIIYSKSLSDKKAFKFLEMEVIPT